MNEQEPRDVASGPSSARRILDGQIAPVMICAALMASVLGLAGWNGEGFPGKWVEPGLGGLLFGAAIGFAVTLLGFGLLLLFASWAGRHRAWFPLVMIVLVALVLSPTFWASDWSGVLHRVLRMLPVFAVLWVFGWLIALAMKKAGAVGPSRMS
jgi:hypothetical protein